MTAILVAGRARALVLLAGGVVLSLAVAPVGPLRFYWTPLLAGLAYLGAAAAGGPRGPLWAPGLVLSCWGGAVVLVLSGTVHVDFTAATVTGLGVGATLAALAGRRGVAIGATGVALSVLLAGAFELLDAAGPHLLASRGWLYGALLAGWGASELRG